MPRDQKIQMTPDVYAAPVILQIDRESQALAATPCNTSKGKGKGQNKSPSWCRRRRR